MSPRCLLLIILLPRHTSIISHPVLYRARRSGGAGSDRGGVVGGRRWRTLTREQSVAVGPEPVSSRHFTDNETSLGTPGPVVPFTCRTLLIIGQVRPRRRHSIYIRPVFGVTFLIFFKHCDFFTFVFFETAYQKTLAVLSHKHHNCAKSSEQLPEQNFSFYRRSCL